MTLTLLLIGIALVYMLDIFVLIWFSGKFVGIRPLPMKDIGILGLAIILLTWLIAMALIQVPLVMKPFILLLAMGFIIYFFILVLDTSILKSLAAGLFFLLCQLVLLVTLLKELSRQDLLQLLRYILYSF